MRFKMRHGKMRKKPKFYMRNAGYSFIQKLIQRLRYHKIEKTYAFTFHKGVMSMYFKHLFTETNWTFGCCLLFAAVLLSCDLLSDSSKDSEGDNLKSILEGSIYFFWAEEDNGGIDATYSELKLQNGKFISIEWNWDTGSKTWVKDDESNSDENYIYESCEILYKDGKLTEACHTEDERSDNEWKVEFTESGDMKYPDSKRPAVFTLSKTKDISGKNISSQIYLDDLKTDAVFQQGSVEYISSEKILETHGWFWLKERECRISEAEKGSDGEYHCNNREFDSHSNMNIPNLESFREKYDNSEKTYNGHPLRFYFEEGTQNVVVYKDYDENDDELDPPQLVSKKGSWMVKNAGNDKVLIVTYPDLGSNYYPKHKAFFEYNGVVYSGHYAEARELNDDEGEIYNLKALESFKSAVPSLSGSAKSTAKRSFPPQPNSKIRRFFKKHR